MKNLLARLNRFQVKLVQSRFLLPATALSFIAVFVVITLIVFRRAFTTGVYLHEVLLFVSLVLIVFLSGLMVAAWQQRLSERLKHLVSEQDQILASVLTNSVDAIIVFDSEETIQMWNRGAQLTFGYSPEEMLGQSFRRLIPPDLDSDAEIARLNAMVAKHGYVRNYITHRITKDGRRITVDISRTRFRSEDGKFEGYTAVVKDVTEKLEFDQKMYNAEKLASLGLLASGVAHEINNPLSIILGFTDLLKDRFRPDSEEWRDLDKIESNANQAKKIVEDLLGFSRSNQGTKDHAALHDCIRILTDFIRQTRLVKKIDLELEIEPRLPLVNGDPREIQQVLLNLINNSIAAMGGLSGTIRVGARRAEPGWVEVSVADDGVGIPAAIRPLIFDPFFTTKEFGEGTGLGLSLCYGLVKKWGGRIEFSSRTMEDSPDGSSGTTFRICIPAYDIAFNPETAS